MGEMTRQAIIFDLDGTLVDSSLGIISSLSSAFAMLGLEPVQPLTHALIGPPLRDTLRLLCANADEASLDHLTDSFKKHYDTIGFQQTYPFPGVSDMLQALAEARIPMHIATNKRKRPTAQILDTLRWSPLFDRVVSPDSFNPPLPNKSGILLRSLSQANLNAEECLYVGDRVDDFNAAHANGMPFAFAGWGFESIGADFIQDTSSLHFPSPDHLLDFIMNGLSFRG
jgi:phosphoglycolate phosphatase